MLEKYEIGQTVGEGNFGKVKYARNVITGQPFAIKILDRHKILSLNFHHQVSFHFISSHHAFAYAYAFMYVSIYIEL